MFRRLRHCPANPALQSYLGMLRHGDADKIRQEVLNNFYIFATGNWLNSTI